MRGREGGWVGDMEGNIILLVGGLHWLYFTPFSLIKGDNNNNASPPTQ